MEVELPLFVSVCFRFLEGFGIEVFDGDMLCRVLLTFYGGSYMRGILFIIIISMFGMAGAQVALDKRLHYAAGVTAAACGYELVYRVTGDKVAARWSGVVVSLLVGVTKETIDIYRPGSGFDAQDLGATVFGGVTFVVTIKLLDKRKYGKKIQGT